MLFNSINYFIFLFIIIIIYFIAPEKYRKYILLLASYFFYAYSDFKNIIILILVTLISFISGLLLEKYKNKNTQKKIIFIAIFLIVGILIYFKYLKFVYENINYLLNTNFSIENIVVPLGISFFTLQAISYPIDVYRKDVNVEKNIVTFALFVSFFPQILSGPIGKSKNMLPQFNNKCIAKKENIKIGVYIILFGLFQKMIIADLLAIGVNNVYSNLADYKGIALIIVAFMYSFQIYFDFNSYSKMAYGSGKIFGYELINNFKSPYFSHSIKEFWSKWHISLSTWFRDYIYFPLGGSRISKNRTYLNILIVFLISGLWHGAAYTFIIWGILHALFQIFERQFNLYFKFNFLNIIKTFILVTFAWIFFRANTLEDAIYFIKNMFFIDLVNIKNQILSIGLDKIDILVLIVSIALVLTLEVINIKKDICSWFVKTSPNFQVMVIMTTIFLIIIFGVYGPGFDNSQFIYLGY